MEGKEPKQHTAAFRAKRRRAESRRRRRITEHDGKERMTKENALVAMHNLAEATGGWISAYPCHFCDYWHVGNASRVMQDWSFNDEEPTEIGGIAQSLGELFGEQLKIFLEEQS